MQNSNLKWIYLIGLALVWGTSFILIKKGLVGLTPIQLGALRTTFAALFLFIIGFKSVFKIKKHHWKWISISAAIGTFFPAFLFAFAELEIDSAIVSILNSTVPILSVIFGFLLFKTVSTDKQITGVIIGLIGSILLIVSGATFNEGQNYWYAILPLIATSMYAINVHVIKNYLHDIPALSITVGCFTVLFVPALMVLVFSGFFSEEVLLDPAAQTSMWYILILAVIGTGIAKILFNRLVQISTPVFSTSVTYLIPVVALIWGFLDGENLNFWQLLSGLLIFVGVYYANKKRKKKTDSVVTKSVLE
ncbi:DMT family transporter [Mesonia sp. K7]|uniref:DMT family transporter n=1 Tax=Mesonia sp. K7 TaxID=2218606 RepID=UPI000DAA95B3|nr:DMT family transporter [Mesonia sp. K7]PZD78955.1 permease [Mesonia sp. K7]